jgi:cytoplasmic iron level regulating protein YaaA (DUF328/UPF0246 family)
MIGLIQCGAKKLPHKACAKDLYIGGLYTMYRRTIELVTSEWYILSAKHGLLRPYDEIDPYDQTLPKEGSTSWDWLVLNQLHSILGGRNEVLCVLASRRYTSGWAHDFRVITPVDGQSLGRCMSRAKSIQRFFNGLGG